MGRPKLYIKEIHPNLFFFTTTNQYYCASTFMRIQEFYESPFKEINNKYFSFEKYMDVYAFNQDHENFTYFQDWNGFNIPGHIVDRFIKKFTPKNDFSDKEKAFIKLLQKQKIKERYYVIGTAEFNKSAFDHELAHGFFYLDKEYKKQMLELIDDNLPAVKEMKTYLKKIGYCNKVLDDELQSYFATGIHKNSLKLTKKDKKYIKQFKEIYNNKRGV